MRVPPKPADERRRLEALHNLCLLDTAPDPRFDRITRLACSVVRVPIALISFVDADRQWFKSRQGLDATESPRDISFCGHAILHEEPLVVVDAREDARFANNPAVIGEPHVRFYAGHPIHAPEGPRVGTLCVVDTSPRSLSSQELTSLADLAALVDAEILAQRFNEATRTAGVGVHERHANDRDMWWSDAMWDIFGQDRDTFRANADNWLAQVHPDDIEYVKKNAGAWGKSRTSVSLQYRIVRPDGTVRHIESIAAASEKGLGSTNLIAGITLDVTDRVSAELQAYGQQQQLRASSHQAGMAEVATGILHSVGNVVNSLGIATETIRRGLKELRLEKLLQSTTLIHANRATLASFLTHDERGKHLPDYLPALAAQISAGVQAVNAELETTATLLVHLRDIVSAQQVHANVGNQFEPVDLRELLDASVVRQAFEVSHIEVTRRYEDAPRVTTDRHKLLMIIDNLLANARDAVLTSKTERRCVIVDLAIDGGDAVVRIKDSGVGMSTEVLSQLWQFGFTTKPNGQGFDLHNSANAAREIGAAIEAHSDGTGQGSCFTVRLPLS